MKRVFALLFVLAICLAIMVMPSTAVGTGPTKDEIRAKWATVTTASTVYEEEPSISAPYTTGKLTEDFLQSGITYLNFIRYVAGLPEVPLDDNLTELSQYGAVCMAANDTLSHYPDQPADMPSDFYNKAYKATTSANISAVWGAYDPLTCLQRALKGCMADNSSYSNLSTVGHRRWLLNPTLGKVGFGFAESAYSGGYTVNHVHDTSGKAVDYDFISWPAAGNHPNELFSPADPWSVTLNPTKYKTPSLNSISITVTEESTGETWTFDSSTGAPANAQEAYLTVDTDGYGVRNCIIFHPGAENIGDYYGVYTVKITGLKTNSGKSTTLTYQVDFFDLEECEHSFMGVTRPSTCYEAGHTFKRCMKCGYETDKETLPLASHSWRAESCLEMPVCYLCGVVGEEPLQSSHRYDTVSLAPTCTTAGYDTHTCSVCGDIRTDNHQPALEHDYKGTMTQATCTKDGVINYECSNCGDAYSVPFGPAIGHLYDNYYAKDETGHWLHCRRCGDPTAVEDHVPGPEATNKNPQTCTVCGYQLAPKLDHTHSYTHTQVAPDCKTEGYTEHTCTSCGHSYQDAPVAALGHNFREGTCTRCGAVDEDYKAKFDISFANMTLGNSLAMNFAFSQENMDNWNGCYAKVVKTYADGRADKVVTIPASQWGTAKISGVQHYTLKFDGVAAKEMSDSVYVTIYDASGKAISNVWEDSVRAYAMRTLNNPASNLETQIMIVDLLNYGAAAQSNFKYNTGDLANNQLSATQKALATKSVAANDSRVKGENYKGTNLGLESQILMRYAFGGTTKDMYAIISFTSHTGTKNNIRVNGSEFASDGVIVIDEIVIADGRQTVTVTVYNANGTVHASATDSLESYIARMSDAGALYEMILKFSDSAYNFFH